jgi:DNA-directed RNA polymerase subunit M/transcription elongation factor TFIIS
MTPVLEGYDRGEAAAVIEALRNRGIACDVVEDDRDGLTLCVVVAADDRVEQAMVVVEETIQCLLDAETNDSCPRCGSPRVMYQTIRNENSLIGEFPEGHCEACGFTWAR